MRKLSVRGYRFRNRSKTSALVLLLGAAAMVPGTVATAGANTVLGQFTLSNYYTPTSPTNPTPTDPNNPLSATVTFTYLNPSANGGYNLAVTIDNTSTPYSSNELIRDVVFQVSDQGSLLTGTPTGSMYLPNSVQEWLTAGSPTTIAAGGSLNYPWAFGKSAAYPRSYDLASQQLHDGANSDMVGPPTQSLGSAGTTVGWNIETTGPVLIPYNRDQVTFNVNVPNLDAAAIVQNVYVGYGNTVTVGGYFPLGGYAEIPSSAAAVPEPSIGLIAAGSLIGAGLLGRRRRNR